MAHHRGETRRAILRLFEKRFQAARGTRQTECDSMRRGT